MLGKNKEAAEASFTRDRGRGPTFEFTPDINDSPRSQTVGAGLLANAVCHVRNWQLKKRVRQQAGSYRSNQSVSSATSTVPSLTISPSAQ